MNILKDLKALRALCKIESNLLLVRITVCIESCLPIGWHTFIWWKNLTKCCSILILVAECWNSLLACRNPKNNWCPSRIFGAWFGGKDMQICKRWSEQAGGMEAFLHISGSELWNLFKYSRSKLKSQKPTAVDVLFKAYPMVPLLSHVHLTLKIHKRLLCVSIFNLKISHVA